MSARVPPPLRVAEYCETFERMSERREQGVLLEADRELFEDVLTDIWKMMTVEECREVELRYPELRLERV